MRQTFRSNAFLKSDIGRLLFQIGVGMLNQMMTKEHEETYSKLL